MSYYAVNDHGKGKHIIEITEPLLKKCGDKLTKELADNGVAASAENPVRYSLTALDLSSNQIRAFSGWLNGGEINSGNVESLLEVDQVYNIPTLREDIRAAMTTKGLNELQQYSLARRFNLIDDAERLQPYVVNHFVKFCNFHLADFLSKSGEGGREVVVQLVKQFAEMKDERIDQGERDKASFEKEKQNLESQIKNLKDERIDQGERDKASFEKEKQNLESQIKNLKSQVNSFTTAKDSENRNRESRDYNVVKNQMNLDETNNVIKLVTRAFSKSTNVFTGDNCKGVVKQLDKDYPAGWNCISGPNDVLTSWCTNVPCHYICFKLGSTTFVVWK